MELTIRPSRVPLCSGGAFLLAGMVRAWSLQQHGAPLPGAVVLLGVAAIAWGMRQLLRYPTAQPPRLRLFADGSAAFHANAVDVQARPEPCSLRFGRYTLLVFHGRPGRRVRLLLGPEILSVEDRAALGRWLQRAPGGGGTAAGVLR